MRNLATVEQFWQTQLDRSEPIRLFRLFLWGRRVSYLQCVAVQPFAAKHGCSGYFEAQQTWTVCTENSNHSVIGSVRPSDVPDIVPAGNNDPELQRPTRRRKEGKTCSTTVRYGAPSSSRNVNGNRKENELKRRQARRVALIQLFSCP